MMRASRFVESYFDAWNHRDPRAVADHLTADGIYCDVPENVRRTHDELIVSLNDIFSNYRYRYELIGDILTLPILAKEIDCSVNHLSQVINSGFGMSFFDYLNQYRRSQSNRAN